MARPWRKRSAWPRAGKNGRRSYQVGFYYHDQRESSKTFPTARLAREWIHDYSAAERRGRDSLRRFLLDLDAKEANGAEGRTIAEVVVRLAKEPVISTRRSARRGGTGYAPDTPPRPMASWALSPQAVEAIRAQMLSDGDERGDALLARRDATIVSLQYGLATRSQEVWGLRWSSIEAHYAWVTEVISYGRLERWGKTAMSTRRRTAIPSVLREDLQQWRQTLMEAGHPARDSDFIIPGDLTGNGKGVRDPATGRSTSAKSRPRSGAKSASSPRCKPSPVARSSPASSALRPTHCVAGAV